MKHRRIERWTVIPCAALLVIFGVGVIFRPHADFSEEENRALADRISVRSIDDIASQMSDFYTDQFPFRLWFTAVKARAERLLLKQENNGVLFGENGALFPRTELGDDTVLRRNLDAFCAFRTRMEEQGIPVSLLAAPRSADIMTEQLPPLYRKAYDTTPIDRIYRTDTDAVLPIRELAQAEQPYYKTDHHWTTEGAYLAYTALMAKWGMTAYPPGFFREEVVSRSFCGTADSSSGGIATACDTVTLYRYDTDASVRVTVGETGEVRQGFYAWEALGRKNCYEVFLGGNYGRLAITSQGEQKPRLLLIKDSFANAMIPFLALHFDITAIDPRYERSALSERMHAEHFDRVLVLWGVDTLSTDASLERLIDEKKP